MNYYKKTLELFENMYCIRHLNKIPHFFPEIRNPREKAFVQLACLIPH